MKLLQQRTLLHENPCNSPSLNKYSPFIQNYQLNVICTCVPNIIAAAVPSFAHGIIDTKRTIKMMRVRLAE